MCLCLFGVVTLAHGYEHDKETLFLSRELYIVFFYRSSWYNHVKKNQLDAQLILSIFRQLLHVSVTSKSIIRRYNRTYTTYGAYCIFLDEWAYIRPKHVAGDEIY